mmetsp:Transcript_1809/g.4560  ORF Transcript_1809/g.4560 Transcript_1809/m.4560 type:complete len:102 (+) Transcript_1809:763-1068(+)
MITIYEPLRPERSQQMLTFNDHFGEHSYCCADLQNSPSSVATIMESHFSSGRLTGCAGAPERAQHMEKAWVGTSIRTKKFLVDGWLRCLLTHPLLRYQLGN